MSEKSTILPLETAVEWTKNYRRTMRKGDAKAFLFHASTMVDILKEMNILKDNGDGKYSLNSTDGQFLRTYLAVDPSEKVANGQKLIFVGTKQDAKGIYRDMLPSKPSKETKSSQEMGDDVNVYDFVDACPRKCDEDSPLGG